MRESAIERHLVTQVETFGGRAYKFKSPNRRNVPDRIVMFPGEWLAFVELKAPKKPLRSGQAREHVRLRKLGFRVAVCKTIEEVDAFLKDFLGSRE